MGLKLCILALLLCSYSIRSYESTSNNLTERPKMKILDLYDDVLQLIIGVGLDLEDLVNVAQINTKFNEVAKAIYYRDYRNQEIIVRRHDGYNQKTKKYFINNEGIDISDNTLALDVIKYFGSSIEKIWILDFDQVDRTPLSALIYANRYLTNSLTHLHVGTKNSDTLKHITNTFNSVKSLKLNFNEFQNGTIVNINETFPNIDTFGIAFHSYFNYDFADVELPNLKNLVLSCYSQEILESFLAKNPQIETVNTFSLPAEYYEIIDRLLPNVELNAYEFNSRGRSVWLKNLKKLDFVTYPFSVLTDLSIVKLESLTTPYEVGHRFRLDDDTYVTLYEIYIEFFTRHTSITKLHLKTRGQFEIERLVKMVGRLPNLIELIIESTEYLDYDVISRIVADHLSLVKFQFTIPTPDRFDVEMLVQWLKAEWRVNYSETEFITVEKRN